MKNSKRAIAGVAATLVMAVVPASANAHPGGTDAAGGHTCRTNCPAHGLSYGQYHLHNGSGGGSTGTASRGGTSVVTQADCDARRIRRGGRVLSQQECERLIGQRVSLADTGFEAWILMVGGGLCLVGAVALRRWRPRGSHIA